MVVMVALVVMMTVVMVSGEGRSGESNGTKQCDEEFLVHVLPAFRVSSFEVVCLSLTLSKGNQTWIPDKKSLKEDFLIFRRFGFCLAFSWCLR